MVLSVCILLNSLIQNPKMNLYSLKNYLYDKWVNRLNLFNEEIGTEFFARVPFVISGLE